MGHSRLLEFASLAACAWLGARQYRQWRHDLDAAAEAPFTSAEAAPVLKATPRISSFVVAYLADEDPASIVRDFEAIDYPNKELLIAIGGAHRIADYAGLAGPNVVLVEHPGGWKDIARERCLAKATGDIFVFTDGDCRNLAAAYPHLVAPIVNGDEEATTGISDAYAEVRDNLIVQIRSARHADHVSQGRYWGVFNATFSALTRTALDRAGGFDPEALGDDYVLAYRLGQAGIRARVVPGATVETYVPSSIDAFIHQQSRWARGIFLDGLRIGAYGDVLRGLRGAAVGTLVLALTASLPITRRRGLSILAPILLHAYARRLRRLNVAAAMGRFRWRPAHFWLALLNAYLDFVVWIRGLVEYLNPRWRRRW